MIYLFDVLRCVVRAHRKVAAALRAARTARLTVGVQKNCGETASESAKARLLDNTISSFFQQD
jgi:hypothetical protein